MNDFFVSYNRHDRAWAEWIAWTLEAAGSTVVIQAWGFRAGENFVLERQKAASEAKRTIAVLSDTYLKSEFTAPEWAAAFAQDPTGKHRTLIPVRLGTLISFRYTQAIAAGATFLQPTIADDQDATQLIQHYSDQAITFFDATTTAIT
ncbi:MAG: toll/interleukin-1 receptor domain-containing protein [Tildeniella nuda ZEHNDER 1965/U140]|jgi:hypothetical protein|nr:toll/interleukin-1 receptor domain-containing protein [Tildeniella nuda ZEHNDER 1965/U140]